jgi:hypothetical protein
MTTHKTIKHLALFASAVMLAASATQTQGAVYAVDLSVGTFSNNGLSTIGDVLGAAPVLLAQIVDAPYIDDRSGPAKFAGTVTTSVYNNDDQNPYYGADPNALTFVYHIQATAGYSEAINSVALDGWIKSITAAGGNFNGPGTVKAFSALRSGADNITFQYNLDPPNGYSQILPGLAADLVLYSPITEYLPSRIFLQNGGQGVADTYAPVPEPATWLAGFGALSLFAFSTLSGRKQLK